MESDFLWSVLTLFSELSTGLSTQTLPGFSRPGFTLSFETPTSDLPKVNHVQGIRKVIDKVFKLLETRRGRNDSVQ